MGTHARGWAVFSIEERNFYYSQFRRFAAGNRGASKQDDKESGRRPLRGERWLFAPLGRSGESSGVHVTEAGWLQHDEAHTYIRQRTSQSYEVRPTEVDTRNKHPEQELS